MKRRLGLVCLFLLGSALAGCATEDVVDVDDGDQGSAQRRGASADEVLESSPMYRETKSLVPADADAARAFAVMQLSPLTPCDIALFADVEDDTLETDPSNFAAWADGAPVKKPKTKISWQEARVLGGMYLAFTDPDVRKARKVNRTWVQALIDRGLDDSQTLTTIESKPGGAPLSRASITECNTYVDAIRNATWGCLQQLVADYLAVKAGRDNLAEAPGELGKMPFYGWIQAGPEGTRNVQSTISNRTMKALSGYLPQVGKQQELQELAAEAVKYFEENEFDDPRVLATKTGPGNWQGYWEIGADGEAMAYCSFEDAAAEIR